MSLEILSNNIVEGLMDSLSGINSNIVTFLFIIFIVILFVVGLTKIKKLSELNKELDKYRKNIEELKRSIEDDEFKAENGLVDIDKVYQNYLEITDVDYSYIKENIKEYSEGIQISQFSSGHSEDYFNEEYLLEKHFNVHGLNNIGSSFIGLGVLGTFIGVTCGLGEMRISNAEVGADVEASMNMVEKLLPNMSTAFITSIAGMVGSLVYSTILKDQLGNISKNLSSINHIHDIIFKQENQTLKILSELSSKVNVLLEKGIEVNAPKDPFGSDSPFQKAVENIAPTIGRNLSGALDKIFNQDLLDTFENIRETLEESNKGLKESSEQVKTVMESMATLSTSAENIFKNAGQTFEMSQETVENYKKFTRRQDQTLQTFIKLEGLQEQTNKTLELYGTKMVQTFQNITDSSNSNLQNINQNFIKSVEDIEALHINRMDAYKQDIETNKNIITDSITSGTGIIEEQNKVYQANLENSNETHQYLENYAETIKTYLETAKNYDVTVNENTNKKWSELQSGLVEYDKAVTQIIKKLNKLKTEEDN